MRIHSVANIFPMMSVEDYAALKADIQEHGLYEPIWLHQEQIVDGRHRYRACTELKIKPEFREWDGEGSLVAFVLSLNLKRRHLNESQRALVGARIKPLFEEEARARKSAGINQHSHLANLPDGSKGNARDFAAKAVNVSPRSVESASRVLEQGSPALLAAVETGRVSVSAAAEVVTLPKAEQIKVVEQGDAEVVAQAKKIRERKAEENSHQRAIVKAKKVALPKDRYRCIVIDPPWPMEKIERDVRPNQVGFEYPTMTEEELKAFPLPEMAADDAHLYLWTTHKFLPMALRLAEHWGFRYQCLMTWVKNVGFTPFSWMYSTEHVLFCRKGSLPLDRLGLRLDFKAKVREHSRKPEEFYELVRTASPGPRIDVFSRGPREGFKAWGNEAEKFQEVA